jgi:hypothetical protein
MCIEFDGSGSGQHVDFGNLDLPSGLSALTIMAWVKFKSFTLGDQRIISKATSHDVSAHYFMFSGNTSSQMRVRLKTGGTTTTHLETSSSLNTGQWYHMGFVYDGSNIIFYRDGAQNGSSSKTGTIDTSGSVGVRIADNPGIHRKELDGFVADCRIYKRALSLGEMQTIHACQGHDGIVDGLLHRWLLNEGSPGATASGAGTAVDLTGSVNGTPAGSPTYEDNGLSFSRRAA